MSMYGLFQTDSELEINGIVLDYGQFKVTISRAGGQNKKFTRVLEAKSKPYRRAMDTGLMDNEKGTEILREVYAEAIVLNWETKVKDKWVQGLESPDGNIIDFTPKNIVDTFKNLPDLFSDIQEQSNKIALFKKHVQEQEAGN